MRAMQGLAAVLGAAALAACGSATSPTSETPTGARAGDGFSTAAGGRGLASDTTSVSDILTMPANFVGQQVQLGGELVQSLGPRSFLFTDGTGAIPADFPNEPLPPLNGFVSLTGTVIPGTGDFAARVTVSMWQQSPELTCESLEDVRARFGDPGFIAGNVVGLFLGYRGVPAGNKTLEIVWDEGNASGLVERFELGEGVPREDGLFDLEGLVGHEYPDVRGPETKTVRANLMIESRPGRCSRVRDAMVTKGDGPGFAAGGALALRLNDPVPSGGFFSVTARVTNPTSVTVDSQLFFATPGGTSIRTVSAGCTQLSNGDVGCRIQGIAGGKFGETFVQYNAPVVTKPTMLNGSVTLIGRDFSPVASYSTTVEP